ncbi:hypothetical protein CCMSSC00406_0009823 [Pleurotus cornucopiae]|uniref:Uncharacterized protein n=1 Tax=Pleurotus cornucopiae TaxID=5321 RepID=A0ACB7IUH7_PLECO|nr:hypothetical protein CCMSSC00406_0009823 [Pleurotus cornucopiae]
MGSQHPRRVAIAWREDGKTLTLAESTVWRGEEGSFAIDFGYTMQIPTTFCLPLPFVPHVGVRARAVLWEGATMVLAPVALLAAGGIDTAFDAFGYRLLRIRVDSPCAGSSYDHNTFFISYRKFCIILARCCDPSTSLFHTNYMSDERDTADFIKSLFRVSGLDEPDLEEGEDWMAYSSGRNIASVIYTTGLCANAQTVNEDDALLLGNADKDEQNDVSEEECYEDLSALSDGVADSKEVEAAQEEGQKPAFQSWCIIA